jgi:hypothetical protein
LEKFSEEIPIPDSMSIDKIDAFVCNRVNKESPELALSLEKGD